MRINCNICLKLENKCVEADNCIISLKDNSIECSFNDIDNVDYLSYILGRINGADDETKGKVYPDKVISFSKAYIDGTKDAVEISNFQINPSPGSIKNTININETYNHTVIKLKYIKIKKVSDKTEIKRFLNPTSNAIFKNRLKDGKKNLVITYNKKSAIFSYDKEYDTICMTYKNDYTTDIEELLALISFYYRIPVEWFREDNSKDGYTFITYKVIRYYNISSYMFNPLETVTLGNISNIQDFVDIANTKNYFSKLDLLERIVNNYVNCQFYDVVGEFVSLCLSVIRIESKIVPLDNKQLKNILHKSVNENVRVEFMFELMSLNVNYKISFEKINSMLPPLKLAMTTDKQNGATIKTFVDLRNEIIHGLQSSEIFDILEDDNTLITKLEILNFSLIVYMLGIKNIQLRSSFSHFDIFEEKTFLNPEKKRKELKDIVEEI